MCVCFVFLKTRRVAGRERGEWVMAMVKVKSGEREKVGEGGV